MPPRGPHKLALYRWAVQHPQAEVGFLSRVFQHHHGSPPWLLREDYCGTAAVSGAWVAMGPSHQAIAIDHHLPTLRWAHRRALRELGPREADLHLVHADVAEVMGPRVHVAAALNFSVLVHHDRLALLRYLRHLRRCLKPRGVAVMDVFGGPGAVRRQTQRRRISPPSSAGLEPFTYHWQQHSHDPATGLIDCRIHFTLADGRRLRDAFRYHWRLWTAHELAGALIEAGFQHAEVWLDRYDRRTGLSDGHYRPVKRIDRREDHVAYVVGVK